MERIDDAKVSPYLTEKLRVGDELELRGPVGGYFRWRSENGGLLLLIGGSSGLVPLMAMLRHMAATSSTVDTRLLLSTRSIEDALYREELGTLAAGDGWPCTTRSRVGRGSTYAGRINPCALGRFSRG